MCRLLPIRRASIPDARPNVTPNPGPWNREPSSPDLHFALEQDLVLVVHLLADQLDEPQHVVGRAPGVGDDEVRVLRADLRAADAEALQPRLVDQRAGAEPARV